MTTRFRSIRTMMGTSARVAACVMMLLTVGVFAAEEPVNKPAKVDEVDVELLKLEIEMLADLRIGGTYEDALKKGAELLKRYPESEPILVELGRTHLEVGRYGECLKLCDAYLERNARAVSVKTLRAQALSVVGRYDDALKEVRSAVALDEKNLPARFISAELLYLRGKRDDAGKLFEEVAQIYLGGNFAGAGAEELTIVARALARRALALGDSKLLKTVAGEVYPKVFRLDPRCLEARVASGNLFASKYQYTEAGKDFRAVLAINPKYVPALVGLARSQIRQRKFLKAEEGLNAAISVNPNSVEALCSLALLDVYDEQLADALALLKKAQAVNPNDQHALALEAACYRQLDRPKRCSELERRALVLNPHCGEFYATVAGICVSRHQDLEAEKLYLKAMELSPDDPDYTGALGMLYMRLGDETKAVELLTRARKMDSFNILTYNTIKLLEKLRTYKTIETENFIVRVDPEVDAVLLEYLPAFLEELHAERSEQFKYKPTRKCLLELFPKHEYFSVRTTGIPFIGTVGACLGPVIAMDSPKATRAGAFSWAQVIKHEYTHVVNLVMTEGRISHWLTEGFAVWSEKKPKPYRWRRLLVDALAYDELMPISKLSHGFTRSRTQARRQLAYAQSELVVEYVIEKYGWKPLLVLVEKYRQHKSTADAIEETFNVKLEQFDTDFHKYVKAMVAKWPLKPSPRIQRADEIDEVLKKNPRDMQARLELARIKLKRRDMTGATLEARRALRIDDSNPDALVVLAYIRIKQRKLDEAEKLLKRALKTDRDHRDALGAMVMLLQKQRKIDQVEKYLKRLMKVEPANPIVYQRLAALAQKRGKTKRAEEYYRKAAELNFSDLRSRDALAKIYMAEKNYARACVVLDEMIRVWPYSIKMHEQAQTAFRETGDVKRAELEGRVVEILKKAQAKARAKARE